MLELEAANSRLKDFYDIWLLARTREFDAATLASALQGTFTRRGTPRPDGLPLALTPVFFGASDKQAQWRGFLRKLSLQEPGSLADATRLVEQLIMPVVVAIRTQEPLTGRWIPPGPWT